VSSEPETVAPIGPALIAYDGSELAGHAIEQAARQLTWAREALVLCVWQPADVGFSPTSARHFDSNDATEVRRAAEETAAHGASLLAELGVQAQSLAVEFAPTWKGIIETAVQHQAGVIVIGSHRREGVVGHLGGSVAAAVVTHATCPVLLVHKRSWNEIPFPNM
jgi:nucleotide-binding universal stress UspA family protein